MSGNALSATLAALAVPRDRVVFLQSSMDWLLRAGIGLGEALEALVDWTAAGGGTLVLPAFPFRGSHESYLKTAPTFDVRRSPARVGLLNETLRRRPGVKRSLDADLSVIALGPAADTIVGSGLTGEDPMGPDSPFQRIIELGGVAVGLGVSLNYMSLVHVLDSRFQRRYGFAIYSASSYATSSIDEAGQLHRASKHAILEELQTHIKPSRIAHELRPGRDTFRSVTRGETIFFLWDLPGWEKLCIEHAECRLRSGRAPCWLAEFEARGLSRRGDAGNA